VKPVQILGEFIEKLVAGLEKTLAERAPPGGRRPSPTSSTFS
jgi:hypothetical protein